MLIFFIKMQQPARARASRSARTRTVVCECVCVVLLLYGCLSALMCAMHLVEYARTHIHRARVTHSDTTLRASTGCASANKSATPERFRVRRQKKRACACTRLHACRIHPITRALTFYGLHIHTEKRRHSHLSVYASNSSLEWLHGQLHSNACT